VTTKDIKVKDLPIAESPKLVNYLITSNNVNYATHSIHKYPAKFIPNIPRWAIRKYLNGSKNKIVLDPFCGSGTSLLEAAIAEHKSIGIDIDPLSRLISKVKLTLIDPDLLRKTHEDILVKASQIRTGKFMPATENLLHWFTEVNINDLSILRDIIEQYKKEKDLYDFLIITFSSIIRAVSNADNQSQKTYVSHTYHKNAPPVFETFFKTFNRHIEQMTELKSLLNDKCPIFKLPDKIDATNIQKQVKNNSVDLTVTSPPYIKAIDYIYNQMVELFWIGDLFDLDTQKRQNNYKRNYIGTKMVSKSQYTKTPKTGFKSLDEIINLIALKDRKHAFIVADYFIKMKENLKSVRKILKTGGHYVMVVGNCNVSGLDVNVTSFLCDIAEKNGYKLHNVFSYTIRNRYMRFSRGGRGGLITHDWIIDLIKG